MPLNLKPAEHKGKTIKTLLFGLGGSGKTRTALNMADHLTGSNMSQAAVIDTENETAGMYSKYYTQNFLSAEWSEPFNPAQLADAIDELETMDEIEVIIIDSATPFWNDTGGTLEIAAKNNKTSGYGWDIATPIQNELNKKISRCRKHLIVTARAKAVGEDAKHDTEKFGVIPVQRADFRYEFDDCIYIHHDHSLKISKTRYEELSREFPANQGHAQYLDELQVLMSQTHAYISLSDHNKLVALFKTVPEDRRKEAKNQFKNLYGQPKQLTTNQYEQAYKQAQKIVEDLSAEDPFLNETEQPEKPEKEPQQ